MLDKGDSKEKKNEKEKKTKEKLSLSSSLFPLFESLMLPDSSKLLTA